MKLLKRECPIEMCIIPCGAGWTDISFFVPGKMSEPLILTASYIERNVSDLARALYYLYPNQFETGRADDIIETVNYEYDMKTKRHGKIYRLGEKTPPGAYTSFPVKAEFHWEEDPGGSDWTLTREIPDAPNYEPDFPLHLHIALERYSGGQFAREYDYNSVFDFDFMYSDLCYAVGKAMTDSLKSHGLYGFFYSTSDCIDLVHLVFLKAIALGCMDVCKLNETGKYGAESTNLQNEIELILFDM